MNDKSRKVLLLQDLIEPLCGWYASHRRDLPWRRDREAYHIWVSEIMLQQTRAETVRPYYERFINELPDIDSLAGCPEDRLLKLWEGLGYYSRVRNMQKAARMIKEQGRSELPSDRDTLLSLPGIGEYTAGAIASIAFGETVSAVDGNVLRILSRILADDRDIKAPAVRREFRGMLEEAMNTCLPGEGKDAGDFNQALMDLGACICLPNAVPTCGSCPLEKKCRAHQNGKETAYPVRREKKARRIERKTILLIRDGEHVAVRKRPEKGLLAGLYEFPNLEGHAGTEEALDAVRAAGLVPLKIKPLEKAEHIFSHVEWQMTGYEIHVAARETGDGKTGQTADACGWIYAECRQIEEKYPVPSAFSAYAKYLSIHLGTGREDGH